MHAETGQPIYFWNRPLKGVVLQKPDFFVYPFMKPEKKTKTLKIRGVLAN